MRHTFVTELSKGGIAVEWRAALAGHKFGGMTSEVYTKKDDVVFTKGILEAGLAPLAEAFSRVAGSGAR
jgi:integrase